MENKVLAVVNGKDITERNVEILINNLDPQSAMQFKSEEGKKRLLEELIIQELFFSDAMENGYDKDEEFLNQLDILRENLLKQYSLNRLFKGINVEDAEVETYYNDNVESFKSGEKANAKHILVDTEEEANNILKEIKEGLSFEEAATKYSKCPSKDRGGDLGSFARGQMVKEFEDATFVLEIGEISEAVKTQFGYHIIMLVSKEESKTRTLEECKAEIMQKLTMEKEKELYVNKTNELRNKYTVEMK